MNDISLALRIALAGALLVIVACGSSNSGSPGDAGPDQTTSDVIGSSDAVEEVPSSPESGMVESGAPDSAPDAGLPAPPAFGTQIDRMGRPAVNTALNHTFDTNAVTQGAAKNAYNADSNPANWTTYIPEIKANLAVYDGLDTVCGNQLGFGALGGPDYSTLATVLSADALWLNTASLTCTRYLAVELNALGIVNTDCGGRTLTENTIDATYNALAGTFATTPLPITNGSMAPSSNPSATFPYLATPH
jgi:hypothetical protein